MTFFRQKIKQKLIEKQHKNYNKEVLKRNITYDKWIEEKEKTLKIDFTINEIERKSQTSGSITEDFGGEKNNYAGIESNNGKLYQIMTNNDRIGQENKKTYFIRKDIKEEGEIKAILSEVSKADYIVLSICEGRVTENAYAMIYEQFQNENVILVYGDEDLLERDSGVRKSPWLKPDWSPDRFLSGFYLGSLIAVRVKALAGAWDYCRENNIFDRLPAESNEKAWLYLLLFEMLSLEGCFLKREEEKKEKISHIKHVLYSTYKSGYEQLKDLKIPDFYLNELTGHDENQGNENQWEYNESINKNHMLSIVIPSKDNPEVLFHCLDSLVERTRTAYSYEIVLVDNGSSAENRDKISRKADALNTKALSSKKADAKALQNKSSLAGCRYLYEQMDFNFSKMCNLGAENATGDILLFLNDDMEVIQPDWLDLMLEKALLSYAGAVGAKLLYPDSDIIQHAGVTNLRVGPAHKLQYLSDKENHYYGMNRGVHNMLAVTGACLMVRREVFWEAGGFCEELAVAFNDVDLCFSIYEKGYYNIVRNDVALYHHESLSRGKDGESEEKQLRHLREKDLLYERHLELYGRDPFYHPYLLNDMLDSQYSMAYCNQVTLDMEWSRLVPCRKALERAREDKCLVVGMECARDIYRWLYSISPKKGKIAAQPKDMGYYFQGYSFIIGADNACYKKKFLLKNKNNNQILAIAAENRYRQDIKNNLPDQMNVGLTGFAAKLPKKAVPAGIYQFGILAEDQCSRQKLVNWSNWVMEVEEDGRQSVREGKG